MDSLKNGTRPVGAIELHDEGEEFDRIGKNKRVISFNDTKDREIELKDGLTLPCTADVVPTHPPYYNEYTYHDMFNGFLLSTLSAEVNYRYVNNMELTRVSDDDKSVFMKGLFDKYQLRSAKESEFKSVALLPGHNCYDKVVDAQILTKFVDVNTMAVIKPHPISREDHIRFLGITYGYNRMVDKSVSGVDIVYNADKIAVSCNSELMILAILLGKEIIDISKYLETWTSPYSPYIYRSLESESPQETMFSLLLNENSPYIRNSDINIGKKLEIYSNKTLDFRDIFRMSCPQRISVVKFDGQFKSLARDNRAVKGSHDCGPCNDSEPNQQNLKKGNKK